MSMIVMIRHGETQWNADRRSQGWMDPPLNDLGKRQAALMGEHVRTHYEFECRDFERFDKVYDDSGCVGFGVFD